MRALVLVACLSLAGCGANYTQLAADLASRKVHSCLWYSGAAGPWAQVQGVTATGGMDVRDCLTVKRP